MSAIKGHATTNQMPFALRPMNESDIAQAAEIERDAFPTLFPPTSFRRELKNHVATYLVAWQCDGAEKDGQDSASLQQHQEDHRRPLMSRLFRNARHIWPRRYTTWEPGQQLLVGFVGTWYMAGEAHIVAVGVRSEYRGRGIGELLLIGAIEHALEQSAENVTLEVRLSNYVAQNLYKKYGFRERGVRKGYYTDNREDALIMTTSPIKEPPYPQEFRKLVQAHQERWGHSQRVLS